MLKALFVLEIFTFCLDISESKNNKAMKFGQLIKYTVRNIFLQKSWRKKDKETSSRPLIF